MASKFNTNIKVKKGPFSLEVKGANEIMRNLELTKNQQKRLRKFLLGEGARVMKTAKELVPVDEQRLSDSHEVVDHKGHPGYTGSGKSDVAVDIVAGGKSVRGRFVDYAAAVHEGNPGHPIAHLRKGPRPWLANAIKLHSAGYMKRLGKAIKIYGRKGGSK